MVLLQKSVRRRVNSFFSPCGHLISVRISIEDRADFSALPLLICFVLEKQDLSLPVNIIFSHVQENAS